MKYSSFGIVWFSILLGTIEAQNLTHSLNKTKRNLSRDIQSYGEASMIVPLASNPKVYYEPKPMNYYQARPLALVDLSQPVKVIEPKVAAEHVLYEFQQTPTDSVSNVHVKQLFEPNLKPHPPLPSNIPPSGVMTSETILAPVQHAPFVQNHVQSFNIKQHPLYNVQPSFFEPKKYVYGKIIVDSTIPQSNNFPQTPTVFHSSQHFIPQGQGVQLTHGKPIISYVNHFPRNNLQTVEQPPPITQPKFKAPPKSEHQHINNPIYVENSKIHKPKSNPVVKPVVENDEVEEDVEDKSEYEEDDHDEYESPFEKYFDEDENQREHENFEEDDEEADEDNKRGSSTYYLKTEHYPKKHRKSKKHKPTSKYGSPDEKYFKSDKYKYKYKHAKKSKYPRAELDGRFSEPIPVTHKKKILKEQWFLSKISADKFDKND